MAYYCYILECANGTYYTGWTKDPGRRLQQHNAGSGARYTRMNRPARLVYVESVPDHISALKREAEIKGWSHKKKEKFVHNTSQNLARQFQDGVCQREPIQPGQNFTVVAPGRINFLGEHVDYNDGVVLPVAIDQEVRIEVTALAEAVVRLHALDLGEHSEFSLDNLEGKKGSGEDPLPGFAHYPAGVAWALLQAGLGVRGMEASYSSTIPIGAGLSSSAAIEMGFALAWQILGGWEVTGMELAQLCQQAENHFVGVQSGLMDQFASCFGVAGHALQFDTRSLEWSTVKLPEDIAIVIADSSVRRNLAGSAYNDRRNDCEEAVRLLKNWLPGITSLRDVSQVELEQFLPNLPERVGKRARHVVDEIERVRQATQHLSQGNTRAFGQLMYDSHNSLRDLYQVSCPELDALVEIATGSPGCLGSKLSGAGFGGCTVSLVKKELAGEFMATLGDLYLEQTGKQAHIYQCNAAQGARRVN
ncbi:MAG: galactokinase [Anaerolineaceae bacterium]